MTTDVFAVSSVEHTQEIAELARWILAHCHEDLGKVRLCITMNNPGNLPVEELFLNAARKNKFRKPSP